MRKIPILAAEDDTDDCELIREALRESHVQGDLHFVHDGEQLLDYLLHRGAYQDRKNNPEPGLILLDLNMPKMDGTEALREIKKNKDLCQIPVVILSTSSSDDDISTTYGEGASSYITKPGNFEEFVQLVQDISHYWLEVVQLPARRPYC